MKKRLIVGMSGASGAPLTIELLQQLQAYRDTIEVHFVMTRGAQMTLRQETDYTEEQLYQLADRVYDNRAIGDGPSSGSFRTMGMVVVPCSMKTLAGIVSGYSENLLLRAADVTLKEHRRLVLVPRECPLSNIHLRNMYEAGQAGAVIIPPVLSYYNRPECVQDCTTHIVGKILDQFDLECTDFHRWMDSDET